MSSATLVVAISLHFLAAAAHLWGFTYPTAGTREHSHGTSIAIVHLPTRSTSPVTLKDKEVLHAEPTSATDDACPAVRTVTTTIQISTDLAQSGTQGVSTIAVSSAEDTFGLPGAVLSPTASLDQTPSLGTETGTLESPTTIFETITEYTTVWVSSPTPSAAPSNALTSVVLTTISDYTTVYLGTTTPSTSHTSALVSSNSAASGTFKESSTSGSLSASAVPALPAPSAPPAPPALPAPQVSPAPQVPPAPPTTPLIPIPIPNPRPISSILSFLLPPSPPPSPQPTSTLPFEAPVPAIPIPPSHAPFEAPVLATPAPAPTPEGPFPHPTLDLQKGRSYTGPKSTLTMTADVGAGGVAGQASAKHSVKSISAVSLSIPSLHFLTPLLAPHYLSVAPSSAGGGEGKGKELWDKHEKRGVAVTEQGEMTCSGDAHHSEHSHHVHGPPTHSHHLHHTLPSPTQTGRPLRPRYMTDWPNPHPTSPLWNVSDQPDSYNFSLSANHTDNQTSHHTTDHTCSCKHEPGDQEMVMVTVTKAMTTVTVTKEKAGGGFHGHDYLEESGGMWAGTGNGGLRRRDARESKNGATRRAVVAFKDWGSWGNWTGWW